MTRPHPGAHGPEPARDGVAAWSYPWGLGSSEVSWRADDEDVAQPSGRGASVLRSAGLVFAVVAGLVASATGLCALFLVFT